MKRDELALAVSAVPVAWLLVATALVIAGWMGYAPFLAPAGKKMSPHSRRSAKLTADR